MPSCVSSRSSDTFKSNNTITPSSKIFICIFKATESPFNMIYSLTERHQHSRAAAQSTPIPSPSKHTGMTATSAFPDTSSHSPTRFHKQIWESAGTHGWTLKRKRGIGISFAFMNHLNLTWHPFATKTQGAGVQAHSQGSQRRLRSPSEHPTVTRLSKKILSGHTDNCLGTFPTLACTAEGTEQSCATGAELQLNSTKFCWRSHLAWA